MGYLQLIALLLLSLGPVSCQSETSKQARKIPQWGTGLIAVTVFLFLVLVIYVAKIVLKKSSKKFQWIYPHLDTCLDLLISTLDGSTSRSNIESDPKGESKVHGDAAIPNGTYGQYTSRSREYEHAYDNPIEVNDNILTTPM